MRKEQDSYNINVFNKGIYLCKILQNQLIIAHILSHIKVLMHVALAVCFLRKCLSTSGNRSYPLKYVVIVII